MGVMGRECTGLAWGRTARRVGYEAAWRRAGAWGARAGDLRVPHARAASVGSPRAAGARCGHTIARARSRPQGANFQRVACLIHTFLTCKFSET